jgi:chromosome segregation ATPase
VLKAVQHCFGATIICDRPDIAEAIAFHPQVRNKTVTLDGDSYDPSGTLTGGSKANLGETLHKVYIHCCHDTQSHPSQYTHSLLPFSIAITTTPMLTQTPTPTTQPTYAAMNHIYHLCRQLQRLHAQQTELDALRAELKAVQADLKTMTKVLHLLLLSLVLTCISALRRFIAPPFVPKIQKPQGPCAYPP